MNYQQLTENERYMLSALRKQGLSTAKIANALGRHKSTIYREVQRNSRANRQSTYYQPAIAHSKAVTRRSHSRRNQRLNTFSFIIVEALLSLEWSPEQIVGYLKRKQIPTMCHETIYQYIWTDKAQGGLLWKYLRQSSKKRRKRYKSKDSRGRLATKRNISERPEAASKRLEIGHWEIDTVVGRGTKHCIVTLVERLSGYTLIGQLDDRTTHSLNKRVIELIRKAKLPFKTITADNGTEFHQYQHIEEAVNCLFYFANPYHSWERGTNENTNGLIRQYLPKGTSLALVTQKLCNTITHRLNTRPRKRLGFKTPLEYINEYLSI